MSGASANAAHTSAVPNCAFVRFTSDHVSPPPETVSCCAGDPGPSDSTNATSHRPGPAVENGAVVCVPEPLAFVTLSTTGATLLTVWGVVPELPVKLPSPA